VSIPAQLINLLMRRVSMAMLLLAGTLARADVSTDGMGSSVRVLETHALAGPLPDADRFCTRKRPHCVHGGLWNYGTDAGHDFLEGVELERGGRHVLALRTKLGWWLDEHALDELGAPDGSDTTEAGRVLALYLSRIEERRHGERTSIVTTMETVLLCTCDAAGIPRCARPITAQRQPAEPESVDPLHGVHLAKDGTLAVGARHFRLSR
jgi:hypothetical protein